MSRCAAEYFLLHPAEAINIRLGGLVIPWRADRRHHRLRGSLPPRAAAVSLVDRCHRSGSGAGSGHRSLGQLGQPGGIRNTNVSSLGSLDRSRVDGQQQFAGVERFHPTFLYESLFNLANAALLTWVALRVPKSTRLRHGDVLAIYLINYGAARFLIERIRTDSLYLGPLPAAYWLSWGLIAVGVGLLIFLRRARSPHTDPHPALGQSAPLIDMPPAPCYPPATLIAVS